MFHIIFPGGNKSKIKVLDLPFSMSHEIDDYLLASRKEFTDREEATIYAKILAGGNRLEYVPDEEDVQEEAYLD